MSSFDKYSNYTEETGFNSVIFGSNKPVLEVELNELQQIINTKLSRIIKALGTCIIPLSSDSITFDNNTMELSISNCIVIEDSGFTFYVKSQKITLGGENQYAYFKVQEVTVDYNSTIKEYGNEDGNSIQNPIKDSRSPIETTRRNKVSYSVLSGPSVPNNTNTIKYIPICLLSDGSITLLSQNNGDVLNKIKSIEESLGLATDNIGEIFKTLSIIDESINSINNNINTTSEDISRINGDISRINTTLEEIVENSIGENLLVPQYHTYAFNSKLTFYSNHDDSVGVSTEETDSYTMRSLCNTLLKPGTYTFSCKSVHVQGESSSVISGIEIFSSVDEYGDTTPYTGEYEGLTKNEGGTVYAYLTDTLESDGEKVNSITFTIKVSAYIRIVSIVSCVVSDMPVICDYYPMLESGTVSHGYQQYKLGIHKLSDDIEEIQSIYTSKNIHLGRNEESTVGEGSCAFGYKTTASGDYSFAEGSGSSASGSVAHAEGLLSIATGDYSHAENGGKAHGRYSHAEGSSFAEGQYSHAEGFITNADGDYSHTEGYSTTASNYYCHAEGYETEAYGICSHSGGYGTFAKSYQCVVGVYNNYANCTDNGIGSNTGTAFCVGNGSDDSSRSNAFRVTAEGKLYSKSSSVSTGADYAEYFEFSDGNPNEEDRVGYFITFDDKRKVRIANKDDYILGISSGNPCVIGNGDEDWRGRFVMDDMDRFITEEIDIFVYNENGEKEKKTVKKLKENPDYDKSIQYIPRGERKEWIAVGMIGVLPVYDDGTCEENGYCTVGDGGIATSCNNDGGTNTYRVLERVNDNVVRVLFR